MDIVTLRGGWILDLEDDGENNPLHVLPQVELVDVRIVMCFLTPIFGS